MNKLILIWGGAIILYLFLSNREGTSSFFAGISNGTVGVTKALQGR
jgi:hypothetical protein